ncbi:hypothetical protein AMJ44_09425 [candidate division WOR-1 bacterium DG_54_3]|uniref:Organic solvent tolerance-like N-terminal domain-containing protein n=1 Tax=candidate division WOR-1 bacterium DG_54_3 TaxID=1703775 RepID=A0A0S7XU80_UNCSA|nr:MAG: hypothetical protein AMJ44_09425 [candidate division WOR-1 bacterium DG_54_3]
MLKRFFLLFSISLFLFSSQVFAQEEDLIINANNLSYDKERNLMEAEGSVEVVYKDVTVRGNYILYNTETERIQAEKGFLLNYGDISIEGQSLDYEIKNKTGKASEVRFGYQGIELSGQEIELETEKFNLKNASFTTCDLEEPHYHVTAREIIFYPEYGWMVAYWGYFWLGRFPLVPMPTYIYDLRAEEKAQRNLPPFPEVGSNDEDGTYINERLAWHISRELSGTYSISYADKKGLGGGAEANYILAEDSRGNVRLYGNAKDNLWGGITHWLSFGEEIEEESPYIAFFAPPKYRRYELETTLSHRERINYQRVSYYPNLVLRSRKGWILRKEARYDAELMAGMVKEEDNVELARGGGNFVFYCDLPEIALGDMTPSVSLDSRFYSNGGKWIKTTGGVDLRKSFSENLSLGLGYLHYFSVEGQSPFNFEMYRFNATDRFTSDLFFVVGETGVGFSASYFVDTWEPEDLDYSLFFRLHCYNLVVKYRSLRREFELGFSLVGG